MASTPQLPPAPADLLDTGGGPRFGAYAGSLLRAPLDRGPGSEGWLRRTLHRKRWVYVFAASEEAMVGAAAVEAGWFAGGFAWVYDRALGAMAFDRGAAGLPGIGVDVGDRIGDGARARFAAPGLSIAIEGDAGRHRLRVVARGGVRIDLVLEEAGAPVPFVLVAPVDGPGYRATQKAGGLRAEGRIDLGGRSLRLDGGRGGLDATHGLLARATSWRWAFGTGALPGGAPVAFNLAEGFGGVPPGDPGENALLLGAAPVRLPPVAFTFDCGAPLAPWRIASADGAVALEFTPLAAHRDDRNLGLLRTRFLQVPGTFAGRIRDGDRSVEVAALPGVVEDHWARW